jgi:beta-lactamase regulating signal transducer with metallopeptidase domain
LNPADLVAALAPASTGLLLRLAWASAGGSLFAIAAWLVGRHLRRLPPAWIVGLWWLVCLKLLVGLVWVAPVELALLPAPAHPAPAGVFASPDPGPVPVEATAPGAAAPAPARVPTRLTRSAAPLPWRQALAGLWLAGLAAGLARSGLEIRSLRRLRREAEPAAGGLVRLFDHLRHRLGIRGGVELRLSDAVEAPCTIGLLRPAVLLPRREAQEAPIRELTLLLGHELLHVERRDLWLGWVPILARRAFFFLPLAALAEREYGLGREAACDAAVIHRLEAPPRDYGRLLVRWGTGRRVGSLAVASMSTPFLDLKRRLQMLERSSQTPHRSSRWWWLAAAVLIAGLVPFEIVAEPPAPPAPPVAPAAVAPPAVPAPAATVPAPPAALARSARPAEAAPGATPAPPTPPAPPAPPAPPEETGTWTWRGDGNDWALLEGNSHTYMSGSSDDMARARSLRSAPGEPLLWMRRGSKEYVIRDAGVIARARKILQPQIELGKQQGDLGDQQGKLGGRQGELGGQQGQLGAEQGKLGAEMASLAAEQAALTAEGVGDQEGAAERADRRRELDHHMHELSGHMHELSRRQKELGARQKELGAQQRELGRQQKELGHRQRETAHRAEHAMSELLDQAIAQGLAEPVKP